MLEEAGSLSAFLDFFCALEGRKLLVHGGGRTATQTAARLGIETRMVDGRRVTDAPMLDVCTMVYGGLVNKRVVAGLAARGVRAIGLTGADADLIRAHRREVKDVDYGLVGDIDTVDGEMLGRLIEQGLTPVVAPLTHDGAGALLNTNADTIASQTACALARLYPTTLVFCFEKAGVLRDPGDDQSVIPLITPASYARLKAEGIVAGGMIPKIDNAFEALHAGVSRVIIKSASSLADPAAGTIITL